MFLGFSCTSRRSSRQPSRRFTLVTGHLSKSCFNTRIEVNSSSFDDWIFSRSGIRSPWIKFSISLASSSERGVYHFQENIFKVLERVVSRIPSGFLTTKSIIAWTGGSSRAFNAAFIDWCVASSKYRRIKIFFPVYGFSARSRIHSRITFTVIYVRSSSFS